MGKFQKKIEESDNNIFQHKQILKELEQELENQTLVYDIVLDGNPDEWTLTILKNNLDQITCQVKIAELMIHRCILQKEYYVFLDETN